MELLRPRLNEAALFLTVWESMTSKNPAQRHLLGQVPLEEYFATEEDLRATLAAVHYKTVAVFLSATHPSTGKATGRDNYICGLEGRISHLEKYVMGRITLRREFGLQHLPRNISHLSRFERDRILSHVHSLLVSSVLVAMRDDRDIWYFDGDWCFSNTVRVLHDKHARMARKASNTYLGDQRNYHGRPSKQGRRRQKQLRTAPGVSIGG